MPCPSVRVHRTVQSAEIAAAESASFPKMVAGLVRVIKSPMKLTYESRSEHTSVTTIEYAEQAQNAAFDNVGVS